jgi:hypothetical protein
MKTRRNGRRIFALPSTCLFALAIAVGGCDEKTNNGSVQKMQTPMPTIAPNTAETATPTVAERVALGRTAIAAGPARNIQEFKIDDAASCVFLIGENHASVVAQQQEATVLGQLLDTGAIDAVFLEGSKGPVDMQGFAGGLQKVMPDSETTRKYWDRELATGRIGAGEYIALTRPHTPVLGIEDMTAKAKMEIAYLLDAPGLRDLQKASRERGAAVLDKGLQTASVSGRLADIDQARLRTEIQTYRAAVEIANVAFAARSERAKPVTDLSVRLIVASTRVGELHAALVSDLDAYEKDVTTLKAAQQSAADYKSSIDEYNQLVPLANSGDNVAKLKAAALKQQIGRLGATLERAEAAGSRIKEFVSRAEVKEIVSLNNEIKAKLKERETLTASLQKLDSAANAAEIAARDAYCIAANDLCNLSNSLGVRVAGVDSFYRDEARRVEREQSNAAHQAELLERDSAMAANSAKYLKSTKPCAALVVGYAHIEGVTAQLKTRGVTVVRCDLPGNDAPITHWELRAYERRRSKDIIRLFSYQPTGSIRPDVPIKRLEWKEERLASATALDRVLRPLSLSSSSTEPAIPFEGLIKGREVVIRVSPNSAAPEMDFGQHIAVVGTIPSRPEWGYEAYDRAAARKIVNTLSNSETLFAYYFRRTAGSRYGCIITPNGEMDLPTFSSESPRSTKGLKPNRVVLFGEPDERDEAGVLVSPTWRSIRGSHGGENGPPNGDSNGRPPSFDEPGGDSNGPTKPPGSGNASGGEGGSGATGHTHENFWGATFGVGTRERIPVYRTINPARAKEHLAALSKQDPSHFGNLTFVDENNLVSGLERLPFTPSRGDYSQTVVIVARNVVEFREAVAGAARAGKLANKQIALITCGDAFSRTAALRELLLDEGALLVWVPERQITPEAAANLRRRIEQTAAPLPAAQRPRTIDQLIDKCLKQWYGETPNDPDLLSLELASSYVMEWKPSSRDTAG